jgi:predicted transcriptional regulator
MNPLVPGLSFAVKHELTLKEMEAFIPFIDKPLTSEELGNILKKPYTTLNHLVMRLKLKGLLQLKEKTKTGSYVYEAVILG